MARNPIFSLRNARTQSVIAWLREHYRGRWRYDKRRGVWVHEDGWYVYTCAALTPRHDGDDDTFTTEYHRADTGERLPL
jgi:hypothetical protein